MTEQAPASPRGRPRGGKKATRDRKAIRTILTTPVMGNLAPLRSRGRPRGGASGKPRRNGREMVDLYDTVILGVMEPNADAATAALRTHGINNITPARYQELLRHIRATWRHPLAHRFPIRGAGSRAPLLGRTSTYQFAPGARREVRPHRTPENGAQDTDGRPPDRPGRHPQAPADRNALNRPQA